MPSITNDPMDVEKLTAIFKALGADDPEGWAHSQVSEGINQLGRYIFISEMWKTVIDKHDTGWVDKAIKDADDESSWNYEANRSLKNLVDKGIDVQDLINVVRSQQYSTMFDIAYLMDSMGSRGELPEGVPDISWTLFEVNEKGEPTAPIYELHEDILEMDPQKETN